MKLEEQESYELEWKKTLDTLHKKASEYSEIHYFLKLGKEKFSHENMLKIKPNVILLGLSFPEEILLALEKEPVYVVGGGFTSANWADQMVPRDTDAATKSILGMLTQEDWNLTEHAVVLVPITCDSMRKLAYLLKEQMNVIPVELPSDKENESLRKQWKEEVQRVIEELEVHLHKRLKKQIVKKQMERVNCAREEWQKFMLCCREEKVALPGSILLYVANSYFWTDEKERWVRNLKRLRKAILQKGKEKSLQTKEKPSLLLVGSPIYAPNYKIPFLLEELGMQLVGVVHPMFNHLVQPVMEYGYNGNRREKMVEALAENCLQYDMSPAFVKNDVLLNSVKSEMEQQHYDGVVFHVLKGQIEYDFELNRLESYLEEKNVPIFRLETDYNYQDIEQLRIRLEAFGEMLVHRAEVLRRGA